MEEKLRVQESVSPQDVRDLYDDLTGRNWALRAFGALLESADLGSHFSDNHANGAEFRWGLNQIVELYIEHMERRLNTIRSKSLKNPDAYIKGALDAYENVNKGAITSYEVNLEIVRMALNRINVVISKYGTKEYPQAENVRQNLLKLQDAIVKTIQSNSPKTESGIYTTVNTR